MQERLAFDKVVLPNGITIYSQPEKQDYFIARILLPFGHAHNTGDIIPGTAHFLEHAMCFRSKRYPQRNQFMEWVELEGGETNAGTSLLFTNFKAFAPSEIKDEVFDGLFSHVFEPEIKEEDIVPERERVSNERGGLHWYPSDSEITQYVWTNWMDCQYIPRDQMMGSDDDLAKMSASYLEHIQARTYYSNKTQVIIVGADPERLCRALELVPTLSVNLQEDFQKSTWRKKEYHEKTFKGISRFQYRIGALFNHNISEEDEVGLEFLEMYLCNSTHGPIYKWVTGQFGCYEVRSDIQTSYIESKWNIMFPLNSMKQVQQLRTMLPQKIKEAFSDQQRVEQEIRRRIRRMALWFSDVRQISSAARDDLIERGSIVTMGQIRDNYERLRDPKVRFDLYERYFAPEHIGEFCAVPEK